MEKKRKIFDDPFDGEYIGNVFGWRISIIGFITILGMIGLCIYLYNTNGYNNDFNQPPLMEEVDSLSNKNK